MNRHAPWGKILACVLLIGISAAVLIAYYRDTDHPDPAWIIGEWVFDADGAREQLVGAAEPFRGRGLAAIPAWERATLSFNDSEMVVRRGAKETRLSYRVDFAVPGSLHIAFANGGDLTIFIDRERVMWDESDVLRLVWKRVASDR